MQTDYQPADAIRTPFLRIDYAKLMHNLDKAQATTKGYRAGLRPHFKAHKCLRIAKLQIGVGAVGITCATLDQASLLADNGVTEILVAYPVIVDQANRALVERLCSERGVTLGISSMEGARRLAEIRVSRPMKIAIEVDVGCKRTGVHPYEVAVLARTVLDLGLQLVGIFDYPGHGYMPGQSERAASDEFQIMSIAFEILHDAGFEKFFVSGGSTPTLNHGSAGVITDYRPGTYVFGDSQQLALGSVAKEEIALTVEATVVEANSDRVVIDAGGKALGRDSPRWLSGYGTALEGDLRIERLFDHHGVFPPIPTARVGDRMRVIPNNANSAVNQHGYFWVDMQDRRGLLRWRIDSPGR
jgi:D-serine deaminase-like pyridoxal phosphate-dependent protein